MSGLLFPTWLPIKLVLLLCLKGQRGTSKLPESFLALASQSGQPASQPASQSVSQSVSQSTWGKTYLEPGSLPPTQSGMTVTYFGVKMEKK